MTSKSIALRENLITLATLSPNREHGINDDTRPQTDIKGSGGDDVNVNGSDSRNEDEAVIRYITFWKDGFSFKNWNGNGDEELMKYGYEDSDSRVILEKMNQGMALTKLLDVKDGQRVELLVCKRLDELYPGGLSSKGIPKSSESSTEVKSGFKKDGELGKVKKGEKKVKVGTITSGMTEMGSKTPDGQESGCILS